MIVTVCSGKGGSAKTKTTVNLGRGLFNLGAAPSASIDADYGASLTRLYGYTPDHPLLINLMDGTIDFEAALHDTADEVPLIPGTPELSHVPLARLGPWRDRWRALGEGRLLLIDTSDDIASAPVASAILAADLLVVPLQFTDADYDRTFTEISGILEAAHHSPEEVWVATMVDGRTAYEKKVAERLTNDGREISARIPRAVAAREADLYSRSVVGQFPKQKVSEAYMDLANVVLARLRRLGYTTGKGRAARAARSRRPPNA